MRNVSEVNLRVLTYQRVVVPFKNTKSGQRINTAVDEMQHEVNDGWYHSHEAGKRRSHYREDVDVVKKGTFHLRSADYERELFCGSNFKEIIFVDFLRTERYHDERSKTSVRA